MQPFRYLAVSFSPDEAESALREVNDTIKRQASLLCAKVPLYDLGDSGKPERYLAAANLCAALRNCGWQTRALPHVAIAFYGECTDRVGLTTIRMALEIMEDAGYVIEWRYIPAALPQAREALVLVYGCHGTVSHLMREPIGGSCVDPRLVVAGWLNRRGMLARTFPLRTPAKTIDWACTLNDGCAWDMPRKTMPRAGIIAGFESEAIIDPEDGSLDVEAALFRIVEVVASENRDAIRVNRPGIPGDSLM